MNPLTVNTHVGSDGMLNLSVPSAANRDVTVTIVESKPAESPKLDHAAFIQSLVGRWQGDFERPDQGVIEERDPM